MKLILFFHKIVANFKNWSISGQHKFRGDVRTYGGHARLKRTKSEQTTGAAGWCSWWQQLYTRGVYGSKAMGPPPVVGEAWGHPRSPVSPNQGPTRNLWLPRERLYRNDYRTVTVWSVSDRLILSSIACSLAVLWALRLSKSLSFAYRFGFSLHVCKYCWSSKVCAELRNLLV